MSERIGLHLDLSNEDIIRALRAGLPPFDCQRFGQGAFPSGQNRCEQPWVEIYDAECSPEAIACVMFRHEHYHWRRTVRLPALLARRPHMSRDAATKVAWCMEMLETLEGLADDTNIPHAFLSGYDIPDHFDRTREYLERRRPRPRSGVVAPLMFPELRRTRSGNERILPNRSAVGFHVMSLLGPRVDQGWSAYFWMPDGRTRSIMHEHVVRAHQLKFPRPIPWNAPAEARRTRQMDPYEAALLTFETAPGVEEYVFTTLERATGTTPCLFVGPDARECHSYETFPVAIAGAEVTMNMLANNARDWLSTPFSRVVNRGFQRYFTYLGPHLDNPNIALDPEEVTDAITRAKRAEAQGWVTTVGAVAGAVAAINPIASAVVGILLLAVSAILEFAPMAEGGSGCPVLGVRRMLTDASCAPVNPQGHPNVVAGLRNLSAHYFVPEPAGEGSPVTQERAQDRAKKDSGSYALPLLGLAAATLLGVALYRSKQKQSPSSTTTSSTTTPSETA